VIICISASTAFRTAAKFIHYGTTVMNQNYIHEEVKSTWNSGNACYRSVQTLSSSRNVSIKIHKTIILPVVLYGCETSSLTLREEHRLMVCGNRVLRRIFRPKREEVAGGWRRLHNEELHNLYASKNIIRAIKSRRMRQVGHVERVEVRNTYNILFGKPEEKSPLG
jgi:hypothetical protein